MRLNTLHEINKNTWNNFLNPWKNLLLMNKYMFYSYTNDVNMLYKIDYSCATTRYQSVLFYTVISNVIFLIKLMSVPYLLSSSNLRVTLKKMIWNIFFIFLWFEKNSSSICLDIPQNVYNQCQLTLVYNAKRVIIIESKLLHIETKLCSILKKYYKLFKSILNYFLISMSFL